MVDNLDLARRIAADVMRPGVAGSVSAAVVERGLADHCSEVMAARAALNHLAPIVTALEGAILALRSYQHGNAATDLARGLADHGDQALLEAGYPAATPGTTPVRPDGNAANRVRDTASWDAWVRFCESNGHP